MAHGPHSYTIKMGTVETDIINEIEDTKKLVEQVLVEDSRARNSDLWLILAIWQRKQNINILVDYNDVPKMISPESIRRCRQTIQNTEGRLLPTDPLILFRRKIKQEVLSRYYAPESWQYLKWQELKYGIK